MTREVASTRDKILDAAARLFHEQGYHATGIATILREADANAGSLYHVFPSKEALLEGVLERYVQLLRPVVMDPVEDAERDPIGRVFALLEQYRRWLSPNGFVMGCPIGNLALEVGDNNAAARVLIDRNFANWSAVVRSWLDAAGNRLPAGTDRKRLGDFVLTVMEGAIMLARASGSPEPFDAGVEQLRRYFDLLQEQALTERRTGPGGKSASRAAKSAGTPTRPARKQSSRRRT